MAPTTPPYLYTKATARASDPCYNFDPKAVTRASYYSVASSASPLKPKQEGPLIDFNQHPDSYVIVPYGRSNKPPMHPSTKGRINGTRWGQFALRLLQLIGSLGALVCVICLRGINDVQGWILRVPPAVDAVVCAYSLYHLRRPAKARPASSSASYFAFSLFVDIAMVPFYVFIAFFSGTNWIMAPGEVGRWTSFFHSPSTDGKLLESAFLIGIVVGALHLFSIPIDMYLVWMFRKIAEYPPDMNPLEDNLTARPSRTHKYKNSDVLTSMSEPKFAMLSGSSLHLSSPSRVSAGKDQLIPEANVRPISFYQSRDHNYSGHTPESARHSRFEYQQVASANDSQATMHRYAESRSRSRSRSRSSRPQSSQRYMSNRASYVTMEHDPMPARPLSFVTATENLSRDGTPQFDAPVHEQKQALLTDNWYVVGGSDSDLSSRGRRSVPDLDSDPDSTYDDTNEPNMLAPLETGDFLPQPLRMHPPTPPKHAAPESDGFHFDDQDAASDNYSLHISEDPDIGRAFSVPPVISTKSSFYSQESSDGGRNSPRGKRYGDLASATSNIRGGVHEQTVPRGSPRVISRSGVDIADASVLYMSADDSMGSKGRNVSGKIAEEGLGGEWAMRKRQPSGRGYA